MKKLIYILLLLPLFAACSSDSENVVEPTGTIYSKTDSVFEYRFGSTIEEVNPDVRRSADLAFSYSGTSDKPATVFYFTNDSLTTVSKYYPSRAKWLVSYDFLGDVRRLEPTNNIDLTSYTDNPEDYVNGMNPSVIYLKTDSISWDHQHLNILVRNDYFSFESNNIDRKDYYLVIEYQKK